MQFDYFYEIQAESYSFYRIPRILFTEEIFEKLSTEAKVLYGFLLDRISLSREHGWMDEAGRVFVYCTIKKVKRSLRCANSKACGLLKELENFGLIERKKQGQGKPAVIYVKDFTRFRKSESLNSEDRNLRVPENGIQDFRKSEPNKTKKNNTEINHTHSIHSEGREEREKYTAYFSERLQIDWLKEIYPYDRDILDEIFGLIIDTVCSNRDTIQISGEKKPASVIKSQFMKLDGMHIQFVLNGLKENTTKVKCIKQYLLATLYNAPLTINNYYQSLVNHDISHRDD